MIRFILKLVALRILNEELCKNWIHRENLNIYVKWMGRDFPIMNDMHEAFKNKPCGYNINFYQHREDMGVKYQVHNQKDRKSKEINLIRT